MIDRRFIRTSCGLIHCRTIGAEKEGVTPLFLLHASPASSQSLEPLMRELSEKSDELFLIAPDTPGNGDSAAPEPENPDMGYYGKMLLELSDALGVGNFDVFGHHTGSHIGIEAAIHSPERINHLILDGVAVLGQEERAEYLKHYAPPQKPEANGSQFYWAWHYMRDQMIFAPHFCKDTDHLRSGGNFSASVLHNLTLELLKNIETYHLTYNAVFNHDVQSRAQLVSTKTMVLTEKTSTLDKNAAGISELISDSIFAPVTGGSHEEILSAKSKLIGDFLNDQN